MCSTVLSIAQQLYEEFGAVLDLTRHSFNFVIFIDRRKVCDSR